VGEGILIRVEWQRRRRRRAFSGVGYAALPNI
jgi:hypothetical protein